MLIQIGLQSLVLFCALHMTANSVVRLVAMLSPRPITVAGETPMLTGAHQFFLAVAWAMFFFLFHVGRL